MLFYPIYVCLNSYLYYQFQISKQRSPSAANLSKYIRGDQIGVVSTTGESKRSKSCDDKECTLCLIVVEWSIFYWLWSECAAVYITTIGLYMLSMKFMGFMMILACLWVVILIVSYMIPIQKLPTRRTSIKAFIGLTLLCTHSSYHLILQQQSISATR